VISFRRPVAPGASHVIELPPQPPARRIRIREIDEDLAQVGNPLEVSEYRHPYGGAHGAESEDE
jgi:hypothetical protein